VGAVGAHCHPESIATVAASRQVGRDLCADAVLRPRQGERQRGQQALVQPALPAFQQGRLQPGALAARRQLRQLLGQQLLELQPLPGRMGVILQPGHRHAGRRVVKKGQRVAQRRQAVGYRAGRQHLVERRPGQRTADCFAQVGLRQLRHRRIDRRQRFGQRRAGLHGLERRVHHLAAQKAAAQLAPHPYARAARQ
jgi:hypothetical protein